MPKNEAKKIKKKSCYKQLFFKQKCITNILLELSPASEIVSKGFNGVAGFKGDGILLNEENINYLTLFMLSKKVYIPLSHPHLH